MDYINVTCYIDFSVFPHLHHFKCNPEPEAALLRVHAGAETIRAVFPQEKPHCAKLPRAMAEGELL
jgi:hypothetical protein